MSEFIKYNSNYALPPAGFNNLGFTCYYNSLLQGLLSCTSFIEELDNNREYNSSNELARVITYLVDKLKLYQNGADTIEEINALGPFSWRVLIKKLAEKSPEFAQFAVGQQCAAEGFSLFLQALEDKKIIQNLFFYRRKNKLYCSDCSSYFSIINEMNNIFEVEADLKNMDENKNTVIKNMNDFLLKQIDEVDENCLCSNCGVKSKKIKYSNLVMVPEVLFVMSKKYKYSRETNRGEKLNVYTDFPKTLIFTSKNKTKIQYEAVAQIQHSGGLNGGHYWAICKRKTGWFNINDNNVSPATYSPDNNTYIVIYHIV